MFKKISKNDLLYLFGAVLVIIYLQLWFFGLNTTSGVVNGYFARSIDFFLINDETIAQLTSNPGSVNHLPTFIGYFFKIFFDLLGISYSLSFFIFLSLIPYVAFFLILSQIIYKRLNLTYAIIITSGLVSTSISTYMFVWGGLLDGLNYLLILLIYLSFEKKKWKNIITLTVLGIFSHQLVFLSYLLMFTIFFFIEFFNYRNLLSNKNVISSDEKKLSRNERKEINKNKPQLITKSFFIFFESHIKSFLIILFFFFIFQLINFIFISDKSGSYLTSSLNLKNTIISGLGNTPLNIITTLKFLLIPILILIYWQFKYNFKLGLLLLLPLIFAYCSILIWSDTTRIMMHFCIVSFFICLNVFLNNNNALGLNDILAHRKKNVFLKVLIICSILNIVTPSFIVNDNNFLTYSRLSLHERDQYGNVSSVYSSLENQDEIRWTDKDGKLNFELDKNDYFFNICSENGYRVIHFNGIYNDDYEPDWNKFLPTNCSYYLKNYNFLQNKWRLFVELQQ